MLEPAPCIGEADCRHHGSRCPSVSCLLNADVSGTGGGGKAYGLEAIAGIYNRVGGSGTTAPQRIPRDRKPNIPQADQRVHTTERWGNARRGRRLARSWASKSWRRWPVSSNPTRPLPGTPGSSPRNSMAPTTPISRAAQCLGPPWSSRDCRFAVATRDHSPWGPPPPSVSGGSAASANGRPGPG
jgi:hypothetical protein